MVSNHRSVNGTYMNDIRKEIALINKEYEDICPEIPGEKIFDILKNKGNLIIKDFVDEKFWGIYINKNDQNFFIINSNMMLEQQIFAAAHELAHSMEFARIPIEVLNEEKFWEHISGKIESGKITEAEFKANRFAAELLIDEKVLIKHFTKLKNVYEPAVVTIKLADLFLVPFRTVAKRFIEVNLYKKAIVAELLNLKTEEIRELAKRYECCTRNFTITKENKFSEYVNKALALYENEKMTYARLKKFLDLVDSNPIEFGVEDEGGAFGIMKDYYSKEHPLDNNE